MDKHVENMDNFKVIHIRNKILTAVLIGLLIALASVGVFAFSQAEKRGEDAESCVAMNADGAPRSDIIRFHVRANSNSEEDQKLKLKVRNEIIGRLQTELEEAVSPQSCGKNLDMEERAEIIRNYAAENLEKIEEWAEIVIKEEGYDYEATAELGVTWIPEKTYDGITFPAGNYEALNVNIGAGAGENWWCVIFPPLCLVGNDENIDEEEDGTVLFESKDGSRLVLKSKILELLQQD